MHEPSANELTDLPANAIEDSIAVLASPESGPRQRYYAAMRIANAGLSNEARATILLTCLNRSPHLSHYPIILALGDVHHELSIRKLRAIVAGGDEGIRYAALKGLARQKDPTVMEQCRHDICHGTDRQREDAIILLGILDTPESRRAIDNGCS